MKHRQTLLASLSLVRPTILPIFFSSKFCSLPSPFSAGKRNLSVYTAARTATTNTATTISAYPGSSAVITAPRMSSSARSEGDSGGVGAAVCWFRKGLRLHDNRALIEACDGADAVYPLFVWDTDPTSLESRAGRVRTAFILESLKDLDGQLRKKGSRLFCARGKPEEILPGLFEDWDVKKLTYEGDSEPRSLQRDKEVRKLAEKAGVEVESCGVSTMRNLERYKKLMGTKEASFVTTYSSFMKLHENAGPVPPCAPDIPEDLPPPGSKENEHGEENDGDRFAIPTFEDLGIEPPENELKFKGGETEALSRLESVMKREKWISEFSKPKTSPNSIEPDTTALSMYLSLGCLSVRKFWHALQEVYEKRGGTKPPSSLRGQLLWREFNYFNGYTVPNFDKMEGNPVARQIPWDKHEDKLMAWKEARTGFPFIDAIMTQLRDEGWIHHLARHSVACFLTRGDLWQSWEDGAAVFDEFLIDADWSINHFNWQWLSCTAYFYQYYRCYSPVSFGKKTDKNGDYIRKYVPVLKHFPSKYIYEPWNAPTNVQQDCKCIIGKDYPKPIVDHTPTSKENMGKMHDAYDANKRNAKGNINNNNNNNNNNNISNNDDTDEDNDTDGKDDDDGNDEDGRGSSGKRGKSKSAGGSSKGNKRNKRNK